MVQGWKCVPVYLQRASAVRWVHSQKVCGTAVTPFPLLAHSIVYIWHYAVGILENWTGAKKCSLQSV